MIINREQLTELLVKKSSLNKDQVEKYLSELIKRVHEASEEGKSFEIEGFGSFSVEEGELQFSPSDTLETEINNKYAGMKPIELIGAFKQPEEEMPEMNEVSDKPEKESWSFDESAIEEPEDVEEEETAEEEVPDVEKEPEKPVEAEGVYEEVEQPENEPLVSGESEIEEEPETEEPEKPEPVTPEKKESKIEVESKEQDVIGKYLVAVVILIVLGVAGFFIYDMGLLDNSSERSPVTASEEVEQSGQKPVQQEEPPAEISKEEQSQPDQTEKISEEEPSENSEQGSSYGLRGEVNESIDGGYTIVVYSLKNGDQAEINRQELEDKGFRALITRAVINHTLYFRVGIGQFKSVADAQQATANIPEEFQENYFIKRIQ